MAITMFTSSFHADINCQQMILPNEDSTRMIVEQIFRQQFCNMRTALQTPPKTKLLVYQTLQIQWESRNQAELPVVRYGGMRAR